MSTEQSKGTFQDAAAVDFAKLYDTHAEYVARRVDGSFEQQQIAIEVARFKLPNLTSLLPHGFVPRRVIEIGCATGELIAGFPIAVGGRRVGVDISASNIAAAQARFPAVTFHAGSFTDLTAQEFDCVILSDLLEHVENDAGFLADAARLGRYVLVNLPLENNWLNRTRAYGPDDASGHLRSYSLEQGLDLFSRAGLKVIDQRRVWVFESGVELERRQLRKRHFGVEYNGGFATRMLKRTVMQLAYVLPPLGRRLFASNLFVIAQKNAHI